MLKPRLPSHLTLLLFSLLLFSWAYLLSRHISYRDPGSHFFDPSRAYEQRYSLHRSSEAAKYQETVESWLGNAERFHEGGTIDRWPLGTRRRGEEPRVCAVFVTTKRRVGVQYLDAAIASALHGLTPIERKLLDLRIYFSDLNPSDHPSYNSWVANVTDAQLSPSDIASPWLLRQMRTFAALHDYHAKAGLDYSLALQSCLDNGTAPYIAVFEGDVQLADSWFIRVLTALREAESMMVGRRWLLMRLFNEERATGFASKHILGNNVPGIILFIDLWVVFACWNLRRVAGKLGSRRADFLTRSFVLVLTCFTIPAFTILFFQTGKATVLPPKPGLRVENFGCCTQGMVFPRTEVADLIKELRGEAEVEDYDVIMNDYSWRGEGEWLEHLSLYPMMVQHLGWQSVISPEREGDKRVWSVAYEELRAERLREEHKAMVERLLGDGIWVDNRP